MAWLSSRRGLTVLSSLALLAFIERSFLDFRLVYPEFMADTDIAGMTVAFAVYLLVIGGWIWGLFAADRDSRVGVLLLLVLPLLTLVGLGVGTLVSFCPSPCQTAWPLGEASNWIGLVLGVATTIAAALRLPRVSAVSADA